MDEKVSRVTKWVAPCLLFIFRDEVLSLFALLVMSVMVIIAFLKARFE